MIELLKKCKGPILPLLLAAAFCLAGINGAEASAQTNDPAEGFPLGEHLYYRISWLGIPVGTGTLWVKEKTTLRGREVFHVIGTIETNKVLSSIFPVHDEAQSWIDAETLESVQFEKKVDEIRVDTNERMTFDREKKKGYFESLRTGHKNEFDITVPVHDVLSAFFWARRQELVPGKTVKTVLVADQKNWYLDVHVLRRETVKVEGKKVEMLRIEPTTVMEGVERKGRCWINVTDDALHKPVRIVYKAPFGRVVGTLKTVPPITAPADGDSVSRSKPDPSKAETDGVSGK